MDRPEDVQRLYDADGQSGAIRAMQQEARPESFHHPYSWGMVKLNLYPMLLVVLGMGSFSYITNPMIPKPTWVLPVVIMGDIMLFVLWYITLILPPKLAAKHTHENSVVEMGGNPLAGLERHYAFHPISVPADQVEVEPIDWAEMRKYIMALNGLRKKSIETQRRLFRKHGVPIPVAEGEELAEKDPVKYIFGQQSFNLHTYLFMIRHSRLLIVGPVLLIMGYVFSTVFSAFPFLPALVPVLLLVAPLSTLGGILSIVLAVMLPLRRRTLPTDPQPEKPQGSEKEDGD